MAKFLKNAIKKSTENLKSVIAKQETRCMELEKVSADNDSKKKKALNDVKTIEEKLAKQDSLVNKKKKKMSIVTSHPVVMCA